MDLRYPAALLIVCGCQPSHSSVTAPEAATSIAPKAKAPPRTAAEATTPTRPPQVLYRSEIERATARGPGYLLAQLRPEPHRIDGRFAGWRITSRFPDDAQLCARDCDLAIGDIILQVDGRVIERPEQLSEVFERLPQATSLHIRRLRDGVQEDRVYRIVDDAP